MGMDVISYGLASKVAKDEKNTRNSTLAIGIQGTYPHTKERIDALEVALDTVVKQANKLIVNDTINIMKANAKLNSIAKTMKYRHQNMVFEDFLDASGIDASKSSGYALDATNGLVKAGGVGNFTIVSTQELASAVPEKAVLTVEESGAQSGSVSGNIIPDMKSNTMPSGVASASSIYSTVYDAWRAFDRVVNDFQWNSAAGTTSAWLAYDFGSPKIIVQYTLMSDISTGYLYMPKDWTFQGWNGSTWVVLDTRSAQTGWADNTKRTFAFNNSTAYSKYRINITGYQAGKDQVLIGVLEMMETTVTALPPGNYLISRDDGVTWETITPETLFYFTSKSPLNTKLRIKAQLAGSKQLLNYGLTWS